MILTTIFAIGKPITIIIEIHQFSSISMVEFYCCVGECISICGFASVMMCPKVSVCVDEKRWMNDWLADWMAGRLTAKWKRMTDNGQQGALQLVNHSKIYYYNYYNSVMALHTVNSAVCSRHHQHQHLNHVFLSFANSFVCFCLCFRSIFVCCCCCRCRCHCLRYCLFWTIILCQIIYQRNKRFVRKTPNNEMSK